MQYLILNFKTYTEASGENAVKLAEAVDAASKETDVKLIICPQAADIYRIREKFPSMAIWSQHIDPIEPGRNTGWTSPNTVVMAGATGSLVNHSEHKLSEEEIQKSIVACKQMQLESCLCVNSIELGVKLTSQQADFVAFEPEALISTGNSLINADKQEAQDFITRMQGSDTKLILGAGVANVNDVIESTKMGYDGALLSSRFVNAENKLTFLQELLAGFTK